GPGDRLQGRGGADLRGHRFCTERHLHGFADVADHEWNHRLDRHHDRHHDRPADADSVAALGPLGSVAVARRSQPRTGLVGPAVESWRPRPAAQAELGGNGGAGGLLDRRHRLRRYHHEQRHPGRKLHPDLYRNRRQESYPQPDSDVDRQLASGPLPAPRSGVEFPASLLRWGMSSRIGFASLLVGAFLAGTTAQAAQLSLAAQSVMPQSTRQVISINYHRLAADPVAMQLEARVLPPAMQGFEA